MARPGTGYADSVIQRGPRFQRLNDGGGVLATLGSGVAAVNVAIAQIQSGDLVHLSCAPASLGAIASNQGYIAVTSINPGVGIRVGTITGVAYPWDTALHIVIARTKA